MGLLGVEGVKPVGGQPPFKTPATTTTKKRNGWGCGTKRKCCGQAVLWWGGLECDATWWHCSWVSCTARERAV